MIDSRIGIALVVAMAGLSEAAGAQAITRARQAKAVFVVVAQEAGTAEYERLRSENSSVAKVDAFWRRRNTPPVIAEVPSAQELAAAMLALRPPPAPTGEPGTPPPPAPPPPPPMAALLRGSALRTAAGPGVIIPAVTDFVVNRAKEEMIRAYLPAFARRLDAMQISTIVPNARTVLRAAEDIDYRFLLPSLKIAFQRDMVAAPDSLAHLLRRRVPPAYAAPVNGALLGMAALRLVNAGEHPIAVLQRLESDTTVTRLLAGDARLAGRVVGVLAREYEDLRGNVTDVANDRELAWLTWAYAATAAARDEQPVENVQAWVNRLSGGGALVATLATDLRGIEREFEEARTALAASTNATDWLTASMPLTLRAVRWLARFTGGELGDSYLAATGRGLDIARATVEKQYLHALVLTSIATYDLRCGTDGDCARAKGLVQRAMPLLTFAASVASADSSADLVRALTAAAAPVGSYRDKRVARENRFFSTLTLDSYVGFGAGRERLSGDAEHDDATVAGFALPIGIEIGSRMLGRYSLGLLVSPVDLGNVASLRLGGGSDSTEAADLTWSQVFSPAAYLTLGLGNTPFAAGFGVQSVPNARRDEATGKTHDAVRARAFFAINVVLFNLWQSQRADAVP